VKRRPSGHKDVMHDPVGDFFKLHGWSGIDLSALGEGCPDWAFFKGIFGFALEVKTPKHLVNRTSGLDERGLNAEQQAYHAAFRGAIYVVETIADCWGVLDIYAAKAAEAGA